MDQGPGLVGEEDSCGRGSGPRAGRRGGQLRSLVCGRAWSQEESTGASGLDEEDDCEEEEGQVEE